MQVERFFADIDKTDVNGNLVRAMKYDARDDLYEDDLYGILGYRKEKCPLTYCQILHSSEISKAFRHMSKLYHIDKQAGKSDLEKEWAAERYQWLDVAFQILRQPIPRLVGIANEAQRV
jgi:hypothetical protein